MSKQSPTKEEILKELVYVKGLLSQMSQQLNDLHEKIIEGSNKQEIYEHPWYKFKGDNIELYKVEEENE